MWRDAPTFLLPMTKSWVKGNVGSWDFTCTLVNYLHYVCAKIHPNRTTFRVKVLPMKKVVKPKRSNFTRYSTYSASNDKTSSQMELKKLKLCLLLINYFHYVCPKFHPNPTTSRVKGLARKKWSNEKAQSSREARIFWFQWQNVESRGA